MSDRGMKKWAPYASLIEQGSYVRRIKNRHRMVKRPHLATDQANQIEEVLTSPIQNPYRVTYFHDGFIHHAILAIKRLDILQKCVIFDTDIIPYMDLLNIQPYHQ
jgi:hypothetical protein